MFLIIFIIFNAIHSYAQSLGNDMLESIAIYIINENKKCQNLEKFKSIIPVYNNESEAYEYLYDNDIDSNIKLLFEAMSEIEKYSIFNVDRFPIFPLPDSIYIIDSLGYFPDPWSLQIENHVFIKSESIVEGKSSVKMFLSHIFFSRNYLILRFNRRRNKLNAYSYIFEFKNGHFEFCKTSQFVY